MKRMKILKLLSFVATAAASLAMAPADAHSQTADAPTSVLTDAAKEIAAGVGVGNYYSYFSEHLNPKHKRLADLRSKDIYYQLTDVHSKSIGGEATFQYLIAKNNLAELMKGLAQVRRQRRMVRVDFEKLASVSGFAELKLDQLPPAPEETSAERDIAYQQARIEALKTILLSGDWAVTDARGKLVFKVRPSKDYVVFAHIAGITDPVLANERMDDAVVLRD